MQIFVLETYTFDTYSYSGLSVHEYFLFLSKDAAINYGVNELGLTYLENSDLAFDQQDEKHFTVTYDETID